MFYSKCNVGYVLRLEAGEEVQESLRHFSNHVGLRGAFYQGLGAITQVELAFYRADEKVHERRFFDDSYELISLNGNISLLSGSISAHSHVSLSNASFQTISGHLIRGVVTVTVEILITELDLTLSRKEDPILKFKALLSQNRSQLKVNF